MSRFQRANDANVNYIPVFWFLAQRVLAALVAISDRCSGESFLARALPPFKPPNLPSSCAALFFFFATLNSSLTAQAVSTEK